MIWWNEKNSDMNIQKPLANHLKPSFDECEQSLVAFLQVIVNWLER